MRWIMMASLLFVSQAGAEETGMAWPKNPAEQADYAAVSYRYQDELVSWPRGPGFEVVMPEVKVEFDDSSTPIDELVKTTAERHGVDPLLVHAVIKAESNYDPTAVSPKGAIGLMQLMPGTAERFAVDPWIPEQNIDGGVRYLKWLLEKFGDTSLALAGYNAGEGAVMKYGRRVPPYRETQQYVAKVLTMYTGE